MSSLSRSEELLGDSPSGENQSGLSFRSSQSPQSPQPPQVPPYQQLLPQTQSQPRRQSNGDAALQSAIKTTVTGHDRPSTACLSCRAVRQRCDRKNPCSRCSAQGRLCRYPASSNRGRKPGSTNKPATVEKLLSLIRESAVRDQVISALLSSHGRPSGPHEHDCTCDCASKGAEDGTSPVKDGPKVPSDSQSTSYTASAVPPPPQIRPYAYFNQDASIIEVHNTLISPLDLMAAAVTTNNPDTLCTGGLQALTLRRRVIEEEEDDPPLESSSAPATGAPSDPSSQATRFETPEQSGTTTTAFSAGAPSAAARPWPSRSHHPDLARRIDESLVKYFAPQTVFPRDWQVLASQAADSALKLEAASCDPLAARIIDQTDVAWYFKLFFKIRNPQACLLDPLLHTPEFVYNASFTLFSAICALGCAISDRPRDRVLYPALLAMAESNMRWSIAVSIKSLETIQSIMCLQFWAPMSARLSEDPSWLHLSHAFQIARDMGLHKEAAIQEQVEAMAPGQNCTLRERLWRNHERTWLFTFVADKSFGISTGRSMGVSWKDLPLLAPHWWRKSKAGPCDRVLSGIVEARSLLINALEDRKRVPNTSAAVYAWHTQAHAVLEKMRSRRCYPPNEEENEDSNGHLFPSGTYLPILAFYVDHSIMILNAQALRELMDLDQAEHGDKHPPSAADVLWVGKGEYRRKLFPDGSPELQGVTRKNVNTARHLLDLMLSNPLLHDELRLGFHNNQFIMACHALNEILCATKRRAGFLATSGTALTAQSAPGKGGIPDTPSSGGDTSSPDKTVQISTISRPDMEQALARARALPVHLDSIAHELPASSPVRLYANLARFFVAQIDFYAESALEAVNFLATVSESATTSAPTSVGAPTTTPSSTGTGATDPPENTFGQSSFGQEPMHNTTLQDGSRPGSNVLPNTIPEWWCAIDGTSLVDSATWFDMGFLGYDQPMTGLEDFPGGSSDAGQAFFSFS